MNDRQEQDHRNAPQPRIIKFDPAAAQRTGTEPCPDCGALIPDDAIRCSHCGYRFTKRMGAEAIPVGRPRWMLVAAILALLGMLAWLFV